jgi:hypothetical protein
MKKSKNEWTDPLKKIVEELNNAGFSGGLYTFKRWECSCCYGLEDVFFQINTNTPRNWNNEDLQHKITYGDNTDRKEVERFRKLANKLVQKYAFMYRLAKDTSEAIIFKK